MTKFYKEWKKNIQYNKNKIAPVPWTYYEQRKQVPTNTRKKNIVSQESKNPVNKIIIAKIVANIRNGYELQEVFSRQVILRHPVIGRKKIDKCHKAKFQNKPRIQTRKNACHCLTSNAARLGTK